MKLIQFLAVSRYGYTYELVSKMMKHINRPDIRIIDLGNVTNPSQFLKNNLNTDSFPYVTSAIVVFPGSIHQQKLDRDVMNACLQQVWVANSKILPEHLDIIESIRRSTWYLMARNDLCDAAKLKQHIDLNHVPPMWLQNYMIAQYAKHGWTLQCRKEACKTAKIVTFQDIVNEFNV